jgi:hypothetical protein
MTKKEQVLVELLTNRAVAKNYTFRWVNRKKELPSLRNDITSSLFRADYVRDFVNENGEREMILSEMGRIIAEKVDT